MYLRSAGRRRFQKTVTYFVTNMLVRRQNLPEGALKGFGEAAKQCDTAGRVIAVSHGWLQAGHADPSGARKKDAMEFCRDPWIRFFGDNIFWDFISLFQLPRTDAENVLFKQALKNMHLMGLSPYGRTQSLSWLQLGL